MTWNLLGQYLDVLLSSILIVRLFKLHLYSGYKAFIVFASFDSVQALIYIALKYFTSHGVRGIDYRFVWLALSLIATLTTIWMVYALLAAILRRLPGILSFSLKLLNLIFGLSLVFALFTVRPEYTASGIALNPDWRVRVTTLSLELERAFSFAELLTILGVLIFILFFPIQVPRNLAAFAAGLSICLSLRICAQLVGTYLPRLYSKLTFDPMPFVMACCLFYWILMVTRVGEKTSTTLGRPWQAVPPDHLVRQLEAMNEALLRSRKHVRDTP